MKLWTLSIGLALLFSCTSLSENEGPKVNLNSHHPNSKRMNIQFAYTILYVKNVAKSIDFYNKAFGFKTKMITSENDYGEIESGATTLAFANIELGKSNFKNGFFESNLKQKPFGIELAFTTSDVDEVMKGAIGFGAELLEEAQTKPWGQKVGYLRDINGFILEICTPIVTE